MLNRMIAVLGPDRPVGSVVRADCRRLRDIVVRVPRNLVQRFPDKTLEQAATVADRDGLDRLTTTTVNIYLTNLSALFRYACQEHDLPGNPAEGLGVKVARKSAKQLKKPFTTEQLQAIFDAPLYRGCEDDERGYDRPGPNHPRRGRFWVPLIALFSGMRQNEICQLRIEDITKRDGIDVILVREGDGQTLKTNASERVIPVHPELKRVGLLSYAAEMREAQSVLLFPKLPVDQRGSRGQKFSKWFARFAKKAGVKGGRDVSFHSFRHTFRDALGEADVRRDAMLALGGWSSGSTVDLYGSGLRPHTLAREVAKVRYGALDLSHINE